MESCASIASIRQWENKNMRVEQGDIWTIAAKHPDTVIVIPTNVGWTKDHYNVMGAGLAKYAATMDKQFQKSYGLWCQQYGDRIFMHYSVPMCRWLCAAPSKALNGKQPHMSWKNDSTIEQVIKSLAQIREEAIIRSHLDWYLPIMGAGNGGLDEEEVCKQIEEIAWPENVTLVIR
jgi:hypothetical protein